MIPNHLSIYLSICLQVKARSSFSLAGLFAKRGGADATTVTRVAGGRAAAAASQSAAGSNVTSDLECLHTFVAFERENAVHSAVLFGEGEGSMLTASWTGEVQAWDLGRRRKSAGWSFSHFGHQSPVCAIALCGALVCTAAHDMTLRIARCLPGEVEAKRGGGAEDESSLLSEADLVNDMDAPLISAEAAEEFRWRGFSSAEAGRAAP